MACFPSSGQGFELKSQEAMVLYLCCGQILNIVWSSSHPLLEGCGAFVEGANSFSRILPGLDGTKYRQTLDEVGFFSLEFGGCEES